MDTISRKYISKSIFWELAAVLAIWLFSLWLSSYPYNRPLNESDWVTAHTLLSLKALDNWGFLHLFGASALMPYSYELQGADVTAFTKAEGIYLSYPSLWLIFPYIAFKTVSLFTGHYELTPAFIITYNLIVNRFLGGIVVYFTLRYLLDYLFHDYLFYQQLGSFKKCILAIAGLVGWMLPASAMVNTQNLYFSDQAVLLPLYCLFLFILRHKFDFWKLNRWDRLILGVLALIAAGMDWYGLVFIAVASCSVAALTYSNHRNQPRQEIFYKLVLNVAMPLASGIAISLAFYFCQLMYFDDGFKQIVDIFVLRTSEKQEGTKITLSYLEIYAKIVGHWTGYLPKVDRAFLAGLRNFYIPGAVTTLLFIFAPVLAWLSTTKARNRLNFAALSLLYLAPCLQLLLLKQHSYVHGFSAFKMALPIAFSTCVLPVAYTFYLSSRLNGDSKSIRGAALAIILSIYFLPFVFKVPANDYLTFSDSRTSLFEEVGTFIHQELPPESFVFSNSLNTNLGNPMPDPALLWHTKKPIYSLEVFASEKPKLSKGKVDTAEFVFIDYEDVVRQNKIELSVAKVCAGRWSNYTTQIAGRRVIGCNVQELKFALSN
jgi:hypothetical protein